jgi:Fic family protein
MEWLIGMLLGALLGGAFGWGAGRRAERAALLFSDEDEEALSESLQAAQGAVAERIEKRLARIVDKARQEGSITNDGVEELFCISNSTATRYLNELVRRNELARSGVGRGTFYTPE